MASEHEGGHVPLSPIGDVRSVVELGARLQAEASRHGIHNVFDDGGYKELLILRLFGLHKLDRTGDDAEDDAGRRYEIKTVARINARGNRKKNLSITTEHTLTVENLARYRKVHLWIIAVFDQAKPEAIYEISPVSLERYFADWESKLIRMEALRAEGGAPVHLNNPKIPLGFVEKHGTRVWPEGPGQLRLDVEAGMAEAVDILPGTLSSHYLASSRHLSYTGRSGPLMLLIVCGFAVSSLLASGSVMSNQERGIGAGGIDGLQEQR